MPCRNSWPPEFDFFNSSRCSLPHSQEPCDHDCWWKKTKMSSVTSMRQRWGDWEPLSFAANWSCWCLICCYRGLQAGERRGNLAASNVRFNSQTNTTTWLVLEGIEAGWWIFMRVKPFLTPELCAVPFFRTWMTSRTRTSSSNRRTRLFWKWWDSWRGRTSLDKQRSLPPRQRSVSVLSSLLTSCPGSSPAAWPLICLILSVRGESVK